MPLRSIFDMDSGFFRVLSRVADLMILNIVFLVCCIPIITIGPALTAMHYVTLKMAENEEGYIVRGFFKSFRQNFRQATIIWVILLLLGCVLATDLMILRDSTGMILQVMRVFILATFVVYLMEFLYVFPTLARFDNTVRITMKNALFMAIRVHECDRHRRRLHLAVQQLHLLVRTSGMDLVGIFNDRLREFPFPRQDLQKIHAG